MDQQKLLKSVLPVKILNFEAEGCKWISLLEQYSTVIGTQHDHLV